MENKDKRLIDEDFVGNSDKKEQENNNYFGYGVDKTPAKEEETSPLKEEIKEDKPPLKEEEEISSFDKEAKSDCDFESQYYFTSQGGEYQTLSGGEDLGDEGRERFSDTPERFDEIPGRGEERYREFAGAERREVGEQDSRFKGFGIASMVLGILSVLCCCADGFAILFAVLSIVFAGVRMKVKSDGFAVAGLILGIVGIIFNVAMLFIVLTGLTTTIYEQNMIINLLLR